MSGRGGVVASVIPAFDAAPTLGAVLAGLRAALPHARLIVVDDGSRDATSEIARAGADETVRFAENRGKGAALRAGFERALAAGAERVLTVDADGQHDPASAPALLAALDEADVVVGARARSSTRMPLRRRLSNALSARAISACAGCELPDSQSGFRAMRAEVLRRVRATGDRYEFETDFLIRAGREGFRIASVPIATIYGAPSHFREISDAVRVVRTIWRHRDAALRRA